jgi:hypothetical protein
MTEGEWLSSESPDVLLKWLNKSKRHRPSVRKLGLFGCACARRLGERRGEERLATGLTLAERMAEGNYNKNDWRSFIRDVDGGPEERLGHIGAWAVHVVTPGNWCVPETAARSLAGYVAAELGKGEPAVQCRLLREVIGNPYRPITLPPAWRGAAIVGLAEAAYLDCQLPGAPLNRARLGVLADALEEAGADAGVVAHFRGPEDHVRGCHVLDATLGKK